VRGRAPRGTCGLLALATLGLGLACSAADPCVGTELIVGLDAEGALAADLTTIEATGFIDGKPTTLQVRRVANGQLFPDEYRVALPQAGRARLKLRGYSYLAPSAPYGGDVRTTTVRDVAANLSCGERRFVRVRLEEACATTRTLVGSPGASELPLLCGTDMTCRTGVCTPALVPTSELSPYDPNWRVGGPDACTGNNSAPAQLAIGNGQTDYLVTEPNATLTAEAGPQGGHHIWIAVRQRGLRQRGTVLSISAMQAGTGLTPRSYTVVFDFNPDEGGFCKLAGLRFQLDTDGGPIARYLGKPLELRVEAKDPLGRTTTSTLTVLVGPTLAGG
jgi:hypothetical protein